MASFSLKHGEDGRCRSLNSPVFPKKYSPNQNLKEDAFDWDRWRKNSFGFNQRLINRFKLTSSEGRENMEAVTESGFNLFQFENYYISKELPIQLSEGTCEASLLSDNLLTNSQNSIPNDSNSPYINTCSATFTIHLPNFQILVVDRAACRLTNYSFDELCSMKLENIVIDSEKHKVLNLYKKLQTSLNETSGKLLNLVRKDGESIPVSIYLKKTDNPERCLALAEPVNVKIGLITMNENGIILSCNEDSALIFKYSASEFIGQDIHTLLPAIDLAKRNEEQCNEIKEQQITGRTKSGDVFPVSLAVSSENSNLESKIVVWVYTNLNGLIYLNKKLLITSFSSYLIKLLFGFSKKEIINQPIVSLIPTFCKDIQFKKNKSNLQTSTVNEKNVCYWCEKNDACQNSSENTFGNKCFCTLKRRSFLSFNNVPGSIKQSEWSNSSFKTNSEREHTPLFKNLNSSSAQEEWNNVNYFQVPFQSSICYQEDSNSNTEEYKKFEKSDAELKNKIFKSCFENNKDIIVQEGKFLGFGKHRDGNFINIKYQVKIAAINEENFYSVWLSGDFLKISNLVRESNTNVLYSANVTSMDGSLPKDSIYSEQYTKPSSVSLISQCDESLTEGDYSQFYTNIKQIGKGAFGYVKMAFRNSDGLLVVTKFIKKRSINIRSWVFHSNLNMKIPLEISLLTALCHPNIVKVLDVFHNDSFVQLVMEKHGAGFDLFEFINRGPKCDEKLKSYIFRQIISAVHYLDSLGILHRDIKDENVIINEKFEIKLIDFGSATFMPPNETFSKFYGTVEYCSPEVLQGNSYKGPELEIWALGVTLYVLTFGENPFYNIEETKKGQFSIPFPISEELDDLLHKMLSKNVETRISIDKVVEHPWINQSVAVENYRFEEVVRCSDEEAYPPKYVHQINLEELQSKYSRTYSYQFGDATNSNGSLQNLAEMDDIDGNFHFCQKSSPGALIESRFNGSSLLLSSTPLQSKNERLCKSATVIPNRLENSLLLNDCCFDYRDGNCVESRSTGNCLRDFKDTSSRENETDGRREEILNELEMCFKSCCLVDENYLKTNNSSQSNSLHRVKKVYKLLDENGTFLEAEDDTDSECFILH